MRITKFDQDFVGDKPFAITVRDYDQENAPIVKAQLSKFCMKNVSELDMLPDQKEYFAKNRASILLGNDPNWVVTAVEFLENSSVILRFYLRDTCEKCAILLDSRYNFHFDLKVIPQVKTAVTENYSVTLERQVDMPRPHLMILYGCQYGAALANVKVDRSKFVPTELKCLA